MEKVNKLKIQISTLYICVLAQFLISLIGFFFFCDVIPARFWAASITLNLLVLFNTRPYQIMDALIEGQAAKRIVNELEKNRSKQ